MYGWKTLVIPDLVLESDIPYITNYFDYYNLANVKKVTVFKHPEQEYYIEDRDIYGYAVIEIETWYENNSSFSFYENLINEKAKIIYEDPYSWLVEFYDNNYKPYRIEDESEPEEYYTCCEHEHVHEHEYEDEVKGEEDEVKGEEEAEGEEEVEGEEEDEGEEEAEGEEEVESDYEEQDDFKKDPSYEYEEDDSLDDDYYEHVKVFKKTFKKIVKSKTTQNNSTNTTTLESVLVKNKNYMKRNKIKPYNNVWARRLRQKVA